MATTPQAPEEILGMSDEDFLKQNSPSAPVVDDAPADTGESDPDGSKDEDPSDASTDNTSADDTNDGDDTADDEDSADDKAGGGEADIPDPKDTGKAKAEPEQERETVDDGDAEGDDKPEGESSPEATKPEDMDEDALRAFYARLMGPIKANKRTIQLKSVEEIESLVQMGANYTRRMQELAPMRRISTMLEKHDLLDEGKLSFLIDVHNKNPEAIKKLVKDSGIDTLDLDTDSETEYTTPDHSVSEPEMAFRTVMEEVTDLDGGAETIQEINSTWDKQSKGAVWENPEIIRIMHQQRQLGVYDLITAEMERLKTLGSISADTPFIQAYKTVGDTMGSQGKFDHLAKAGQSDAKTTSNQNEQPGQADTGKKVIATRAAAPKSQVANGDRANAAAPAKGGQGSTKPTTRNPLAMSDEEFLKLDRLRDRV